MGHPFNVYSSIRGTVHTVMSDHPACEHQVAVYGWVEIEIQARQLRGLCALFYAVLASLHSINEIIFCNYWYSVSEH